MKESRWSSRGASLLVFGVFLFAAGCVGTKHRAGAPTPEPGGRPREEARFPNRWFLEQRLSGDGVIPPAARRRALEEAERAGILGEAPGSWVNVGPRNIGGRVTAIAVAPNSANRVWIGTADGGVWETTDGGTNWTPRFDSETSLSIGSIAAHPTDPDIVYVGTGEDNGGGYSYDGDGVYKTTDGGLSWRNLGLAEVRRIGRIALDPADPDRVFVAAGGNWFQKDAHRGIYRSTDGGESWQKVLFVADDAGGIDVAVDPSNPNRVYAAIWQRQSQGTTWTIGGPRSGIWRSLDGGTTWTKLVTGLPATAGRIGLGISRSNPATVYAVIITPTGILDGIYRTTNAGDTWAKVSNATAPLLFSTYSYYFGNIRVDPSNPNTVYALDVRLLKSTNGGQSFTPIAGSVHVDWHDLVLLSSTGTFYGGTDGGFYRSLDGGASWTHSVTLPITQFYDLGIDRGRPERRFAGAQDNGMLRTTTGGLDDWSDRTGGDGLQVEVDPTDGNKVYAETQFGAIQRSTNGGDTFTPATNGIDPNDRTNWNTPISLDPVVPTTLYTGTYRVYRSTDSAQNWTAISGDLTNGPGLGEEPARDPRWLDRDRGGRNHLENLISGTITVVAVSPVDRDVLWAGTDDGNVWVSADRGANWTKVNPVGPAYWVTDIAPDPFDRSKAYLSVTGYRTGDKLPYLRVTRDLGQSWEDLSAGLPQVPVNAVLPDTEWKGRLFVGTDVGVHVSDDGGRSWSVLRGGMPVVVVPDLYRHDASRTLYAVTHGRGMYTYDLSQLGPADGDGDGVDNNTDCALDDPGAFAVPGEVVPLSADKDQAGSAVLSWPSQASQAGSGTVYDVVRDLLSNLPTSGTASAIGLACGTSETAHTDPELPVEGSGFYYLVRARNVCGDGGWGEDSAGTPRSVSACP